MLKFWVLVGNGISISQKNLQNYFTNYGGLGVFRLLAFRPSIFVLEAWEWLVF